MEAVLEAKERSSFNKSGRSQVRNEGYIPAVVYGNNTSNKSIAVNEKDFIKTIREVGRNGIITLAVGSDKRKVMLSDYQRDPLKSSEFVHLDFQVVNFSQKIDVDVNIVLTGEASGVKDGGVLQQSLHSVSISVLPNDVPEQIELDVSHLVVGDTVTLADVSATNFEINQDLETTVASILPPKQEEEINSGEEQEAGQPENVEGRETTEVNEEA